MRALVLARDGHRCALCGSTERLMAHPPQSLTKGWRTCFETVLTPYHESMHSGTLIVRIRAGRVIGYSAVGDEIRAPGDPAKALVADQEHAFSAFVVKYFEDDASDKNAELADRSAPRDPQAPPPSPPALRPEDLPEDMTGAEFVKLQPLLSGREGPVSLRTIADSLNLGQEGMRRGALRGSGTDLTDGPADRVADRQCAVVVGVAGLLTLRRQRLPTRDP